MRNLLMTIALVITFAFAQTLSAQVIFEDHLGNKLTTENIEGFKYNLQETEAKKKTIPRNALLMYRNASLQGQQGNYLKAIDLLNQCHEMAPQWAYPVHDMAYAYLLQGDLENALTYYELADELAPEGMSSTKTALYALKKEKQGELPEGLYLSYLKIEQTSAKSDKVKLAQDIVEKYPYYAPAWYVLASLEDNKSEQLKAIEKGLRSQPDAETKGKLLIKKASLLNEEGRKTESIQILGGMIFDERTTPENAQRAKFVIASVAG